MEMHLTVVDPQRRHGAVELTVRVPPGSTAGDLVPAVARELGRPVQELQTPYADGRPLSPTAPVGVPPLVEGVVLTFTPDAAPASRGACGLVEVHVVGGPDSGAVLRLPPGRHRVGRAAEASIRIEDPGLSRVHAELEVGAGGVRVRDLRSTNGTWLEGVRVEGTPRELPRHARLRLGSSTLLFRPSSGAPAAAHPDGEGHLAVNRRPRLHPPTASAEIRLPPPPVRRDAPRLPLMAALLPLVLAVVMWRVLDSPTMLLFGLMSPVMLLGGWLSDRRQGRTTWADELRSHAQGMAAAEQALDAALRRERDQRLLQHPDHALLLKTAAGPLTRLWERRPVDDDFLCLSVGTGTLPSSTTLVDPVLDAGRTTRELHRVPVAVPLPAVGVLGLTGPRQETVGVARALVAQVCGWHSPQDVSLHVLCADASLGRDWAWTAYLPHTRPRAGGECRNLVGVLTAGGDQVRRRVAELTALVARRTEPQGLGRGPWRGAHCVVVLDGAQRLRAVPGVSLLLRDGPAVGVHFICVDTDPAQLPVEAGAVVQVQPGHPVPAHRRRRCGGRGQGCRPRRRVRPLGPPVRPRAGTPA